MILPSSPVPRRGVQRLLHAFGWQRASDAELLAEFNRSGSEEAFEVLVRRHGPMVLGICRRYLGNWHDAEDVFQATFLVLARKAAGIRQVDALGSWLYPVATRLAQRARADGARRRTAEAGRPVPAATETDPCAVELASALDEEMSRLPDKYRTVMLLCCLEGKSRSDAARALGWKEGAVKIRLERARNLLRDRLRRRGLAVSSALLTLALSERAGAAAALPPALATATAHAAAAFAAGAPPAGLVNASVLTLTLGGMPMFAVSKLPFLGVGLAILMLAGSAAVWSSGEAQSDDKQATRRIVIQGDRVEGGADGDTFRIQLGAEGQQQKEALEQARKHLEKALEEIHKRLASHGGGAGGGGGPGPHRVGVRVEKKVVETKKDLAADERAAVSPDGKIAAVISGEAVRLLDTATGQMLRELARPANNSVVFSPDGKTLTITAQVDLGKGKPVATLSRVGAGHGLPGLPGMPGLPGGIVVEASPRPVLEKLLKSDNEEVRDLAAQLLKKLPSEPAKKTIILRATTTPQGQRPPADLEARINRLIEELHALQNEIRGKK